MANLLQKMFGFNKGNPVKEVTNTESTENKEQISQNKASNVPNDVMLGQGVSVGFNPEILPYLNETPQQVVDRLNAKEAEDRKKQLPLLNLMANTPLEQVNPSIYQINNQPVLQGFTPNTSIGIFGTQGNYPWAALDMRRQSMLQAMMLQRQQEQASNVYPSFDVPQTFHAYQQNFNRKALGYIEQLKNEISQLPEKERELALMQIRQAGYNPNTEWGRKIYNINSSLDAVSKRGIQIAKAAQDIISDKDASEKDKSIANMFLSQDFDLWNPEAPKMMQYLFNKPAYIKTIKEVTDGIDEDVEMVLKADPEYMNNPYGTILRYKDSIAKIADQRINDFIRTWGRDNNIMDYFPDAKDATEAVSMLKSDIQSRFAEKVNTRADAIWNHSTNVSVNLADKTRQPIPDFKRVFLDHTPQGGISNFKQIVDKVFELSSQGKSPSDISKGLAPLNNLTDAEGKKYLSFSNNTVNNEWRPIEIPLFGNVLPPMQDNKFKQFTPLEMAQNLRKSYRTKEASEIEDAVKEGLLPNNPMWFEVTGINATILHDNTFDPITPKDIEFSKDKGTYDYLKAKSIPGLSFKYRLVIPKVDKDAISQYNIFQTIARDSAGKTMDKSKIAEIGFSDYQDMNNAMNLWSSQTLLTPENKGYQEYRQNPNY